jgi:hypothetical protein
LNSTLESIAEKAGTDDLNSSLPQLQRHDDAAGAGSGAGGPRIDHGASELAMPRSILWVPSLAPRLPHNLPLTVDTVQYKTVQPGHVEGKEKKKSHCFFKKYSFQGVLSYQFSQVHLLKNNQRGECSVHGDAQSVTPSDRIVKYFSTSAQHLLRSADTEHTETKPLL